MSGTSSIASIRSAKEARFRTVMRSAFPERHWATTSTNPPGASRVKRVSGSAIAIMPVSKSTVATHMALLPDIGGV